jgi:hypothetical protein
MNGLGVDKWTIAMLYEQRYDMFVASLGFEERCRYIPEMHPPAANTYLALAFADRRELSYAENEKFFAQAGYMREEWADEEIVLRLVEAFRLRRSNVSDAMTLCVDISSMSRVRIASTIVAARHVAREMRSVTVDFVYSVATYSSAPVVDAAPVHTGPVLPEFAGWTSEPERPSCLVLGLGYEVDRALGAFDLLEPADVWVAIPYSVSEDYDEALRGANAGLFKLIADESHKLFYHIDKPFDSYIRLESFIRGMSLTARPILVPFGPKIFALASLLIGCVHPDVAIWRISFGPHEPAVQRSPNGTVTGLRAIFSGQS